MGLAASSQHTGRRGCSHGHGSCGDRLCRFAAASNRGFVVLRKAALLPELRDRSLGSKSSKTTRRSPQKINSSSEVEEHIPYRTLTIPTRAPMLNPPKPYIRGGIRLYCGFNLQEITIQKPPRPPKCSYSWLICPHPPNAPLPCTL